MAIRIIEIAPKVAPTTGNSIPAHVSIQNFKWINEQSLQTGVSSLASMFDWIVNKKGVAYIKKGDEIIYVFGTISPVGQQYLRCLKNGAWSDELLDLPVISS